MTLLPMFLLDIVAIVVMTFGLYFPRHRRKDMVVAYLGINLGLLGITSALSANGITIGIGFGLFAVLSIIRLRSTELDQEEVAYYFAALAIGLLGGLAVSPVWLAPVLMATILAALFIGDSPRLFASYRVQSMVLDTAFTDERALVARLESLLGGTVYRVKVRKVDMVESTTSLEVRFELPAEHARGASAVASPAIRAA